jgi:hypothetical protein
MDETIQFTNQKKSRRFWGSKKVSKKMLLIIIFGLWIIFSIGYILRDQWIKFQNRQILTAYQNGIADTVRTLMSEAETCRPVSLVDGEKTIELMKIGCVREQPPAGQPGE